MNEKLREIDQKNLKWQLEALRLSGVSELVLPGRPLASNEAPQQKTVEPLAIPTSEITSQKQALLELRQEVQNCLKCEELCRARTQTVFGAGYAKAKLVFVGEAPGFDEDKQGLPFVGKAGQLLTKMIESIGFKRTDVFICNVLKCRPPQNRNPKPEEVVNCSPYLWKQLDIIKPKLICALGNFASQTLLQTTRSISQLRGIVHESRGTRIICTFHPAYLLRNPSDKRKAWEDLKRVREELTAVNIS
ncbi:MAG: uracil-DNA glycosylase [Candidatus Omnitrophica bacterium]|nr:uracil-DNA glycosylase [Candidatus Omnitrophota bacterium]